jgi:hypothetical protein
MKKEIPFDFVIERLSSLDPVVKPMFGCHAIYVRDKIVLIVRKKEKADPDNGVWVATTPEHHTSLKKQLPSLRPIAVFGDNGGWQNLPSDHPDFEEHAITACELVLKNDPRVGKIPKAKKKKRPE